MAATRAWVRFCGVEDLAATRIRALLADSGMEIAATHSGTGQCGIICFAAVDDELLAALRECRRTRASVLAVATVPPALGPADAWRLLHAGASDTLVWADDGSAAHQIRARLDRWRTIDELAIDVARRASFIGNG